MVPTGRLGEHQVGPGGPLGKLEELRSPNDLSFFGLDQISEGVMRRMNNEARLERQAAGGIGIHCRFKPSGASEPANLSRQFAALIRHEPYVKSSAWLRARPAVEHHTSPAMLHKQSGGSVARRVHPPDTEQYKTHTINFRMTKVESAIYFGSARSNKSPIRRAQNCSSASILQLFSSVRYGALIANNYFAQQVYFIMDN
jgi:hypothetical protein